jgi:hypothetical protein
MTLLGTNLPEHLIGTDPVALTEFLSGLEQLGYGYVTIGDHVSRRRHERPPGLEALPRPSPALRPTAWSGTSPSSSSATSPR